MNGAQDQDAGPMRDKRVELAIQDLESQLRRILGEGTEFCLVISQDCDGVEHVQAMTNSTPARAHALLRVADGCGFDSLN